MHFCLGKLVWLRTLNFEAVFFHSLSTLNRFFNKIIISFNSHLMYYLDCTTIVKQWHWKRLYLHRVHPSCATHWGRSIRFVYQGHLSTASIRCVHPVSSLGASIRCVHRVRPSGAPIRCVHWECPSGVFISDRVCHQVRRLDTFISCIYGVRPSGEKFTLNITIICTFGLKKQTK